MAVRARSTISGRLSSTSRDGGAILGKDDVGAVPVAMHHWFHVLPLISGDVSTCAMKPTVGHGPFTVDGMVAKR